MPVLYCSKRCKIKVIARRYLVSRKGVENRRQYRKRAVYKALQKRYIARGHKRPLWRATRLLCTRASHRKAAVGKVPAHMRELRGALWDLVSERTLESNRRRRERR